MQIEITERQVETIYNALVDARNVIKKQMEESIDRPNRVKMFQNQLKNLNETITVFKKNVK